MSVKLDALAPPQVLLVNHLLSELETWRAENQDASMDDQRTAFPLSSLRERAGHRVVDGDPLYRRLLEVAGHLEVRV